MLSIVDYSVAGFEQQVDKSRHRRVTDTSAPVMLKNNSI